MRNAARFLLLTGLAVVLVALILSTRTIPASRALQPGTEPSAFAQQDSPETVMGTALFQGGEILTNNHVVAGADVIKVGLFGDTKSYVATLVGRDPISDSAVIRLEHAPAGLPSATLGDSDALEPGDWVMALGIPFFSSVTRSPSAS